MHPVHVLTHLGGTAERSVVLAATSRRRLEKALLRGEVVKVSRGRYALPSVPAAAKAAATLSGVASHLSAATLHRWEVAQVPPRPQVMVPRNRKVTPRDQARYEVRWRDATPGERARRVTDHYRTVLDCARDLPFPAALAVADSALRRGDVDQEELVVQAAASSGRGRKRALRVAEAATPLAANPFESVLRALASDIPGLDLQPQVVLDDRGFLGRPDLVDRRARLVVEADSYTFHGTRAAFERDCERYNALVIRGWTVLRFTWPQVMQRSDYVVASLRAAVDGTDGRALAASELLWTA